MASVASPFVVTVLSYAFAVVLAAGGVMGYATKQSIVSLVMGIVSGAAVGYLENWFAASAAAGDAKSAWTGCVSLVVLAVLLAIVMGVRWNKTGKFMPAGLVCGMAGTMAAVYFLRASANAGAGVKVREL